MTDKRPRLVRQDRERELRRFPPGGEPVVWPVTNRWGYIDWLDYRVFSVRIGRNRADGV